MRSWTSRGFGFQALLAAIVLPLVSGCVAYQTHKDLTDKHAQTEQALRDLVHKYNQDIQKARAGGGTQVVSSGVPLDEFERLKTQLADTQRQLRDQQGIALRFQEKEAKEITGAELEDGGIRLGEALLFNEGEAKLKGSELPSLDQLVELLRTRYPGETVIIEGHTDNQPLIKTKSIFLDNWNLGYQRARSVFEYLRDHGIPPEQMRLETYAYLKPLNPATQNEPEGRRLNRRVVIRRAGAKI